MAVQRAPLLFEKAKLLARTSGWAEVSVGVPDYRWLDSNTVLFQLPRPEEPTRISSLDTRSGKVAEVECLQDFSLLKGDFSTLQVSPNGDKILWAGGTGSSAKWYVTTLGNRQVLSFARKRLRDPSNPPMPDDYSLASWSWDGKSVLESVVSYGGEGGVAMWRRNLSKLASESNLPFAKCSVDGHPSLIGLNKAFASSGLLAGSPRSSVGFRTWNVLEPRATYRGWTVSVPKGRTIESFVHSHSGHRILWDLSVHDGKSRDPWDSIGEEIWLTDAAGAGWKLVATVPIRTEEERRRVETFGIPKWVPGDRAISFVYSGGLYTFDLP